MGKIELLAPAGSLESLYAAVQMGADAVYIGGSKFSARAYAFNFDDEQIVKAVDYCHLYGVKVYVTLNTLLKQNELEDVLQYVNFLYNIGVDALILQDTGLIHLIKTNFPEFEIHASTQMTVHNGEGALLLKELGFKRIVLSRELSLKEVKYISKDLGVETEIFIHGALCICYSGQCLMSSIIGGRSGNRGRCAQPCRLPYTLINKVNGPINFINGNTKEGYILSPKDTCTLENIQGIIESGTSSLKIEGRMKRPEYVAGVVDIYRKAIDGVYENKNVDKKEHLKTLTQLFNREGFSKAYLLGNIGKDMMAYKCPRNTGTVLGKVQSDYTIKLLQDLSVKDGIRTEDDGFTISKIINNNLEVDEAFTGDVVKLKPSKYKVGATLYKTSDVKLLAKISEGYQNPYDKKIDLNLDIDFSINKPIVLSTEYKGEKFMAKGEVVQEALKKPLDKERLEGNLSKSGDTPFRFNSFNYLYFQDGFLPVSAINAVRREIIESVEKYIKTSSKVDQVSCDINNIIKTNIIIRTNKIKLAKINNGTNDSEYIIPKELICVSTEEQLKAALDLNVKNIAIDTFLKQNNLSIRKIEDVNIYLKIPNIIKEEFEKVCEIIEDNLQNIKGIITANLGIINRFKNRTTIIGDYKLNIFNSYSSDFYKDYIQGTCLSIELNQKEIKQIAEKQVMPLQIMVYGKYELMVSEYCPIGSTLGGKCENKSCTENCTVGQYVMKDRMGEEFRVKTDKYCRSHIYNNVPVNLIPNLGELKKNKINSFRLDFIDENYNEALEIIKSFRDEKWEGDFKNYTRGHYKRGVE